LGLTAVVDAAPVVVDPGWAITRTISFAKPAAAHYNPVDGLIYTGRWTGSSSTDGVFRIGSDGVATKLVTVSDFLSGVVVDPDNGNVFYSRAGSGTIDRIPFGSTTASTWVSGFHSGDDDPIGMAIAPNSYTGGVINPGEGLVVDRGFNGRDEIWRFSPDTAEGETVLHADPIGNHSPLVNAVDIAISDTNIYVVDTGDENITGPNPGTIYSVGAGGSLTPLDTSTPLGTPEPVADPRGIAIHPTTGDLYIVDTADSRLIRVDPVTGVVTEIATNVLTGLFAGIDITPDGSTLILSEYNGDMIYELSAIAVPEPAAVLLVGSSVVGLVGFHRKRRRC